MAEYLYSLYKKVCFYSFGLDFYTGINMRKEIDKVIFAKSNIYIALGILQLSN